MRGASEKVKPITQQAKKKLQAWTVARRYKEGLSEEMTELFEELLKNGEVAKANPTLVANTNHILLRNKIPVRLRLLNGTAKMWEVI